MKKILILASILCLIAGCAKKEEQEVREDTQVTNPIIPIHYSGEKMHIMLTDYLPQLTGEEQLTVETDLDFLVENYTTMEFDLIGTNRLSEMSIFVDSITEYDICILPNLPVKQDLVTLGCTDSTIKAGLLSESVLGQTYVYLDDILLPEEEYSKNGSQIEIHLPVGLSGRNFIRVFAEGDSCIYNDLLIPLHDGKPVLDSKMLCRHDDQAQIVYSVLIDRFYNGNRDNDRKLNNEEVLDIVDYQGGDIAGITQKVQDGYFQDLGITTLWISPITQNPTDAWGCYKFQQKADGTYNNKYDKTKSHTKFSGYHGYWPISVTSIDHRFGTEEELKQLLTSAHEHNTNVILDYVANHMHIHSPTYRMHPDWHTDSILPDGRRNFELWDEARLTTWFDVHIPTLDLERNEVCGPMTDSALYWLENYDFDGYRHDACKHIPEGYWRMLTHKMRTRFPQRHIWMIGETYGSPELINTYVKSGMLNAQFDFNVYFTAIHALAGEGRMDDLDRVIRKSLQTYGAHHTMGNISGNHDQVRFASLSDGSVTFDEDAKEAGWTRTIAYASDKAYKKAVLLEVLNMTIPGVPCIYQGDEYGETGAGDPDNRHMMRFDNLRDGEKKMLEEVKGLIARRNSSMPLLYGEYIPVESDAGKLIFDRVYMGESVRITIDKNNLTYSIQ